MIFVWKGKNIFLSYIAQVWKFLWWHVSIIYSGWNTKPAVLKLKCFLWCQAMTQLINWHYYQFSNFTSTQTWKLESQYSWKMLLNNSKKLVIMQKWPVIKVNRLLFLALTCMCNMIKSSLLSIFGKMRKFLISAADFLSTLTFLCCHYIFDYICCHYSFNTAVYVLPFTLIFCAFIVYENLF